MGNESSKIKSLQIVKIAPGSVSHKNKLLPFMNTIVKYNGKPITENADIARLAFEWEEGELKLDILDLRTKLESSVTIPQKGSDPLGMSVKYHESSLNLFTIHVVSVTKGSPVDQCGLINKDYIIGVENVSCDNENMLLRYIESKKEEGVILLVFNDKLNYIRRVDFKVQSETAFTGSEIVLGMLYKVPHNLKSVDVEYDQNKIKEDMKKLSKQPDKDDVPVSDLINEKEILEENTAIIQEEIAKEEVAARNIDYIAENLSEYKEEIEKMDEKLEDAANKGEYDTQIDNKSGEMFNEGDNLESNKQAEKKVSGNDDKSDVIDNRKDSNEELSKDKERIGNETNKENYNRQNEIRSQIDKTTITENGEDEKKESKINTEDSTNNKSDIGSPANKSELNDEVNNQGDLKNKSSKDKNNRQNDVRNKNKTENSNIQDDKTGILSGNGNNKSGVKNPETEIKEQQKSANGDINDKQGNKNVNKSSDIQAENVKTEGKIDDNDKEINSIIENGINEKVKTEGKIDDNDKEINSIIENDINENVKTKGKIDDKSKIANNDKEINSIIENDVNEKDVNIFSKVENKDNVSDDKTFKHVQNGVKDNSEMSKKQINQSKSVLNSKVEEQLNRTKEIDNHLLKSGVGDKSDLIKLNEKSLTKENSLKDSIKTEQNSLNKNILRDGNTFANKNESLNGEIKDTIAKSGQASEVNKENNEDKKDTNSFISAENNNVTTNKLQKEQSSFSNNSSDGKRSITPSSYINQEEKFRNSAFDQVKESKNKKDMLKNEKDEGYKKTTDKNQFKSPHKDLSYIKHNKNQQNMEEINGGEKVIEEKKLQDDKDAHKKSIVNQTKPVEVTKDNKINVNKEPSRLQDRNIFNLSAKTNNKFDDNKLNKGSDSNNSHPGNLQNQHYNKNDLMDRLDKTISTLLKSDSSSKSQINEKVIDSKKDKKLISGEIVEKSDISKESDLKEEGDVRFNKPERVLQNTVRKGESNQKLVDSKDNLKDKKDHIGPIQNIRKTKVLNSHFTDTSTVGLGGYKDELRPLINKTIPVGSSETIKNKPKPTTDLSRERLYVSEQKPLSFTKLLGDLNRDIKDQSKEINNELSPEKDSVEIISPSKKTIEVGVSTMTNNYFVEEDADNYESLPTYSINDNLSIKAKSGIDTSFISKEQNKPVIIKEPEDDFEEGEFDEEDFESVELLVEKNSKRMSFISEENKSKATSDEDSSIFIKEISHIFLDTKNKIEGSLTSLDPINPEDLHYRKQFVRKDRFIRSTKSGVENVETIELIEESSSDSN